MIEQEPFSGHELDFLVNATMYAHGHSQHHHIVTTPDAANLVPSYRHADGVFFTFERFLEGDQLKITTWKKENYVPELDVDDWAMQKLKVIDPLVKPIFVSFSLGLAEHLVSRFHLFIMNKNKIDFTAPASSTCSFIEISPDHWGFYFVNPERINVYVNKYELPTAYHFMGVAQSHLIKAQSLWRHVGVSLEQTVDGIQFKLETQWLNINSAAELEAHRNKIKQWLKRLIFEGDISVLTEMKVAFKCNNTYSKHLLMGQELFWNEWCAAKQFYSAIQKVYIEKIDL